ncbi:elongation factor G [Striga asiatica]|uniref:Elongation factor G n=1 Tax=Striga asiatica TaxID=4170 RepID=A0A5A7R370_STRAF|nr:elongation factor G [Striga asiatica]
MTNENQNLEPHDPIDYVDIVKPSTEWTNMRDALALLMFNEWDVMESTASGGRNSQANGQRRVWTRDEESALIQAQPHISSKITVWKKNYGLILGMLGTSGFEWCEMENMIVVKEDVVWQSNIKANPRVKGMHYKSWPFYGDWVKIFGKDRATGEGAQGFTDVVNGVLHETNVHAPSPIPTQDSFPEHCDDLENNMDSFSAQAGESSASGKSKRDGKRKRNVEVKDKIIGLISSVCEETNKHLTELSGHVLQTKLMQKSNELSFMRHLKKFQTEQQMKG